jgi:hypothetical protein
MTRTLTILFLILALAACQLEKPLPPMQYTGSAGMLFEERTSNPAMGGRDIIEVSLIAEQDTVFSFFSSGPYIDNSIYEGGVYLESASSQYVNDWTRIISPPVITAARFPYTLKIGDAYYTFALRLPEATGIYLWKSSNKTTWQLVNGGAAVLTRSGDPRSIWRNIWNVAACAGSDGKIYLLAECGTQTS